MITKNTIKLTQQWVAASRISSAICILSPEVPTSWVELSDSIDEIEETELSIADISFESFVMQE